MNIEKMISDMAKEISGSKSKDQKELKNVMYEGCSGDDDLSVKLVVSGNKGQIKSITFSDGMKEFIHQSPNDFWQSLSDLIIAAHLDATSKIEDEDHIEDFDANDIMKKVSSMTKNMGGMDEMLKKMGLGGGSADALLKNFSGLLGGGPKKK